MQSEMKVQVPVNPYTWEKIRHEASRNGCKPEDLAAKLVEKQASRFFLPDGLKQPINTKKEARP